MAIVGHSSSHPAQDMRGIKEVSPKLVLHRHCSRPFCVSRTAAGSWGGGHSLQRSSDSPCKGDPVQSSMAVFTQADPVTALARVKIFHVKTQVPILSVIRLLSWDPKELEFPQCQAGRRKREKLVCQEEISPRTDNGHHPCKGEETRD